MAGVVEIVVYTTLSGACLLAGGLAIIGLERELGLQRCESPQVQAMLFEYLPETLALGGAFAIGAPAQALVSAPGSSARFCGGTAGAVDD